MSNLKKTFTSYGKVILLGEHAVVYGSPAFAIPITKLKIETEIKTTAQAGPFIDTAEFQGPLFLLPEKYDGIRFVIETLVAKDQLDTHFEITYHSQIPLERGLGSSASVSYATVNILNDYFELGLTPAEIIELANQAEAINHGSASGLDVATISSEFPVSFVKPQAIVPIKNKLNGFLLIIDTGETGNTREAVAKVRQQVLAETQKKELIDHLGNQARKGIIAWQQQDILAFGKLMDKAQVDLDKFGLATSKIKRIVKIAKKNGALGTKLSGSGLGGIVISLAQTKATAEQIAHAVASHATNIFIEEI